MDDKSQSDEERALALEALVDHHDEVRAALKTVIDAHEKYVRGENGGVRIVVPPGSDLSRAVLDGVTLHGGSLRGADMTGSAVDEHTKPPNGFTRMPKPDWSHVLDTSARYVRGPRDR